MELGIDLAEYYPSVEWDIMKVPAVRNEKFYPCCPEPYPGNLIALLQSEQQEGSLVTLILND